MDVETTCHLVSIPFSTPTPGFVNASGKMDTDMQIGGTYKLVFSSCSHEAVRHLFLEITFFLSLP